MLLTSFLRSSSNSVTGSAGVSSTGAGHLTISNKAITRFCHKEAQKAQKEDLVIPEKSSNPVKRLSLLNSPVTAPDNLRSYASSHRGYRHQTSRASHRRARAPPSTRQSRLLPALPSHPNAQKPRPLLLSCRCRLSAARVLTSKAALD